MADLPISKSQSLKAIEWLKHNFTDEIEAAVKDTPFTIDTICGIACQETAYRWLNWVDKYDINAILGLCVFDATGNVPGTEGQRKAFPVNTAAFETRYGPVLTSQLVSEGNKMRAVMGWGSKNWVYCGYGIFQYDLQAILIDYDFFANKEWYSFEKCLDRCVKELMGKYAIVKNVPKSIETYNGYGQAAENYRDNVLQFIQYSEGMV